MSSPAPRRGWCEPCHDERMNAMDISRRRFLSDAASSGFALLVGVRAGRVEMQEISRASTARLAANQWIAIDESGVVTVWVDKAEMGQGVRTALAAILA